MENLFGYFHPAFWVTVQMRKSFFCVKLQFFRCKFHTPYRETTSRLIHWKNNCKKEKIFHHAETCKYVSTEAANVCKGFLFSAFVTLGRIINISCKRKDAWTLHLDLKHTKRYVQNCGSKNQSFTETPIFKNWVLYQSVGNEEQRIFSAHFIFARAAILKQFTIQWFYSFRVLFINTLLDTSLS